jgi:hypothetical protein
MPIFQPPQLVTFGLTYLHGAIACPPEENRQPRRVSLHCSSASPSTLSGSVAVASAAFASTLSASASSALTPLASAASSSAISQLFRCRETSDSIEIATQNQAIQAALVVLCPPSSLHGLVLIRLQLAWQT